MLLSLLCVGEKKSGAFMNVLRKPGAKCAYLMLRRGRASLRVPAHEAELKLLRIPAGHACTFASIQT